MQHLEPWITCRRKGRIYLLAKGDQAYFAIEVGKGLNWDTEEWLQRQGVSEALLKELHLTYLYYPLDQIRGVAIGGTQAGDGIWLYPKSEKRQEYTLELDYEAAFVESFFENLHRYQPPKPKQPKQEDWRSEQQDRELFHKLSFVPAACLLASACSACGFAVTGSPLWFTLCLLCLVIQLGLLMGMPAYFTLAFPKGTKNKNAWELEIPLLVLAMGMVFRSRINWLSDRDFWMAAGLGTVAGLIIYGFLPDLHRVKWAAVAAALFGALGGWFVIGHGNQVYDFAEPECYILEVENTYVNSSRRNRDCYCVVTLPDGREVKLEISKSVYDGLEIGDLVQVEHNFGALGIEYANVYPLE